ncbi:MAG: DUF2442 domain-containing protein [Mariniphaga sp.]|nr:DUF2442 domain-containing protein [Mariniphaga sp.]
MNPRVKFVKPINDFRLWLMFHNGEVKIFDVNTFLTKGIFKELKYPEKFNSVCVVDSILILIKIILSEINKHWNSGF